jgi:iron complex transport system substrate-binding protein
VVILSPAAADIFIKLGLEDKVVGVTKSIKEIKKAKRIGGHIKPNIELIRALNPDLIVISSNRFFTKEMEKMLDVKVFKYNPHTISDIFQSILEVGYLMNKEIEAEQLTERLRQKLTVIRHTIYKPTVVFESVYMPYTLAGKNNIVADIVKMAGGVYLINNKKKLVKFSIEKVVSLKPDVYIFQVVPMNKKPVHPSKRPEFKNMDSLYIEVDELSFSRANTNSIINAVNLNKLFREYFK